MVVAQKVKEAEITEQDFLLLDMKKSCDDRRSKKAKTLSVKFCKILVGDFSRRMNIPITLVSWFKENLPEVIDLMGPSGNIWHVGLGRSTAGAIFLQYGWREFLEDHYVEEDDILVFEYKDDSCFSVTIFDSSECERVSYFSKNKDFGKQEGAEESSSKSEEQSATAAHESYHSDSRSIHDEGDIPEKSSPSDSDQRGVLGSSKKGEAVASSKRRIPTDTERDAAMQLARSFTSSRPSFLTVMKGYNVCTQFQLLIPPDFAREFLPQESQDIILRVTNEQNEWNVKYGVGETSSRFLGKWRYFARHNNLKVGDACVFELSRERKLLAMMVHIFPAY